MESFDEEAYLFEINFRPDNDRGEIYYVCDKLSKGSTFLTPSIY